MVQGPPGVVPLCNSSARDSLRAMMPACDSHGVDRTWIPPKPDVLLNFFDNLTEVAKSKDEARELTRDTTAQEVACIASRAEEAAAAAAAGEFGFSPEEAEVAEASRQAEVAEIRRLLKLPPDELAGVPSLRHSGIQGILIEAAARGNTAGGQGATAQDAGPSKLAGEEEESGGDEDSDGSLELYADALPAASETSPSRVSPRRSPLKRVRKTVTGARAQAPRQQPPRQVARASRGSQAAARAPSASATAGAALKSAPSGGEPSRGGTAAP